MVAPIVIELAANPAPGPDLARTLVESCAGAAGDGGCILGDAQGGAKGRARVVISFFGNSAHIRVVVVASGPLRTAGAREIAFRDDDPLPERFRAAGLVAAALVAAEDRPPTPAPTSMAPLPEPLTQTPEAPQAPRDPPDIPAPAATPIEGPRTSSAPTWAAAGLLGLSTVRPRAGVWVGVDVPFSRSVGFGAVSVSYEQTLRPDGDGLSEQRETLGVGAGLRYALAPWGLALRLPAELEIEHLRVAIVEPGTGRQDAGSRVLFGLRAGADLEWSLDEHVGLFAGARGTLLNDQTTVRVQGSPVTVVPGWEASLALGLNVRIP